MTDRMVLSGIFFALLLLGCTNVESVTEPTNGVEEPTVAGENETVEETLSLTSPAFGSGGAIPMKYTCDGGDVSPPLRIEGVPENAESLVLIMDDPDAVEVAGRVWDHWLVFNIAPTLAVVEEGQTPDGTLGVTSSGWVGYEGPCPPASREHRYSFRLYALDTMLALPEGATKAQVEEAMEGHLLDETELVGRYRRS